MLGSGAGEAVPLSLETPYEEDDLRCLKWAQSADIMYFAHAQHAPRKLERRGHATWSLVRVAFDDGPYLKETGDSARTLKPAATRSEQRRVGKECVCTCRSRWWL